MYSLAIYSCYDLWSWCRTDDRFRGAILSCDELADAAAVAAGGIGQSLLVLLMGGSFEFLEEILEERLAESRQ
jgi:hypothetical protein